MATPKTKPVVAPKPKRGVGQAISRRRRLIADRQRQTDEQRAFEERQHARQLMEEQRNRHADKADDIVTHRINAARHAVNVLTSDHRAFMAAVGHAGIKVNVTLTGKPTVGTSIFKSNDETLAYTDFESIVVKLPTPPLSKTIKEFVTELRGILHHEAGHVRFTIPFTTLWAQASEIDPEAISKVKIAASKIHRAWNALEDQRMEVAVVRATPRIANYFIPMVLEIVLADPDGPAWSVNEERNKFVSDLAPWLALAGRDYFPEEARQAAKERFDTVAKDFGVTSDEWFDIVHRYMTSTCPLEMALTSVDAHLFIEKLSLAGSPEGGGEGSHDGQEETKSEIYRKICNEDEVHNEMNNKSSNADIEESANEPAKPAAESQTEAEDAEDADDDADGEEQNDGETTSPENGRGSSENAQSDSPVDQLKEQAEKAKKAIMESAEIDDVMSRINNRIGSGSIPTEGDEHSRPMSEYMVTEAKVLATAIEDALESFRTEKSPVWVRRQEQGYLDVLEYRTREHGDTTYHVEPQNWDNNGLGLHVSFLADRSGSMHNDMIALSQTMWAVKRACTNLGVPSTMVMWADRSETARVMEEDDTPVVYNSRGGTYPTTAFDDIDTHVAEDGLHHLVFVFTDGDWSGVTSVTNWKDDNRTFVLIGLRCADAISNKDADVVIPINDIRQLGFHVKSILTDYMASV